MWARAIHWCHHLVKWQHLSIELALSLFLVVFFVVDPVSASMRLQDRSLYMNSDAVGATTFYKLSFRYMSPDPVGSVELLFCDDPIPYVPCVAPVGIDVSGADLSSQTGETGFSITQQSTNKIVLSRPAQAVSQTKAIYTLNNIINPTATDYAFSIRIRTLASTDGTGPTIDFGSVRGQVTEAITIETQVPPMLIFCLAEQVEYDCIDTNKVYYHDAGVLSPNSTLTAQSQMAVGTNASAGFAITAIGAPLSAGTNVIDSLESPSTSRVGTNQFGINLVANDQPSIGIDPEGEWTNAVVSSDYAQSNRYKFVSGDIVASSPNVSLMKKFTVSYIINSSDNLRAGVYTTTLNFIASGRF